MAELPEGLEYFVEKNSVEPTAPIPAWANPTVMAERNVTVTPDAALSQMDRPLGAPPTSAREMAATDVLVELPEAQEGTQHVEVAGEDWVVRLLGSSGGALGSSAPLLLFQ